VPLWPDRLKYHNGRASESSNTHRGIPKQLGSSQGFSTFERGNEGDPKAWEVVATFALTFIVLVSIFSAIYLDSEFPEIFHTGLMLSHSCKQALV